MQSQFVHVEFAAIDTPANCWTRGPGSNLNLCKQLLQPLGASQGYATYYMGSYRGGQLNALSIEVSHKGKAAYNRRLAASGAGRNNNHQRIVILR